MEEQNNQLHKNHLRPFAWVLILVVIAFAAGYIVWARANQSWPYDNEIIGVPTNSPTADWETYSNTTYGFEIKYPGTWSVVDDLANGANIADPKNINQNRISVFVYQNDPENSMRDVNQITSMESVKFHGLDAKQFGGESGITGKSSTFLVAKSNLDYYVLISPADMYDQVFSTFKFTEKLGATADWKTYTNSKYGFELIFPDAWKGYKVIDHDTQIIFELPSSEKIPGSDSNLWELLYLNSYTKAQWGKESASEGEHPAFVAENTNYVFAYSLPNDVIPQDLRPAHSLVKQILSTLKFIK